MHEVVPIAVKAAVSIEMANCITVFQKSLFFISLMNNFNVQCSMFNAQCPMFNVQRSMFNVSKKLLPLVRGAVSLLTEGYVK